MISLLLHDAVGLDTTSPKLTSARLSHVKVPCQRRHPSVQAQCAMHWAIAPGCGTGTLLQFTGSWRA